MGRTNYWHKFEENVFYHIYNRGINGVNIFSEEKNYDFFLAKWKSLIDPFFETHAYCLMPNHYHFLVQLKETTPKILSFIENIPTSKSMKFLKGEIEYNSFLEDQFKRMFSSYALAFNKQENRTGSLFEKRFKRISIRDDIKLRYILAYIHHNPIHHNFENNYEDWKYSSYLTYRSNKNTSISKEMVLKLFDGNLEQRIDRFDEYHRHFKLEKMMEYHHVY